jgi:undecaprenyl diphosphate synthase
MSYKDQIDLQKLPRHVAVIMDGNGRWAKTKGKLRVFGHHNGVLSVRDIVEGAGELNKVFTLYTFSPKTGTGPNLKLWL